MTDWIWRIPIPILTVTCNGNLNLSFDNNSNSVRLYYMRKDHYNIYISAYYNRPLSYIATSTSGWACLINVYSFDS